MDLSKRKDRILTNALMIGVTELALFFLGMVIQGLLAGIVRYFVYQIQNPVLQIFLEDGFSFGSFIIPIGCILLYMLITKRQTLKFFVEGGFVKSVKAVLTGLLIGFLMNGFISLLTGVTGTVHFSFHSFSIYLILLIPPVFIQCAAEEVALRGYVYRYMQERHDWSAVAFVSGTLFIFHHVGNISMSGFSSIFCLNVFLVGFILCLLVKITGNFWIACGFHTAWNFTQEYLFGLPNSGMTSELALFYGTDAKANFFFDPVYGNEGSLCTTVVCSITLLILLWLNAKKEAKEKAARG